MGTGDGTLQAPLGIGFVALARSHTLVPGAVVFYTLVLRVWQLCGYGAPVSDITACIAKDNLSYRIQ